MVDRIDETVKMEDLPTWLQELWELSPYIARRAEKQYLELTNELATKIEINRTIPMTHEL